MRKTRTEWAPSIPRGRWCSPDRLPISSRHPPHPSGTSLTSARSRLPSTRTFNMTRHQPRVHPCSPARPSPHPWPSEGTRTLRLEPWAPHPAVTRDARHGGDRPSSTGRRSRHHQRLLHRDPLIACDLVSHSALFPSKQCTSSGNPPGSTSSPTWICGSTRRSLLIPTRFSSSPARSTGLRCPRHSGGTNCSDCGPYRHKALHRKEYLARLARRLSP